MEALSPRTGRSAHSGRRLQDRDRAHQPRCVGFDPPALEGPYRGLVFVFWSSLVFGVLPYLLFAAMALYLLRGWSTRKLRRSLLVAPFAYTALFALLWSGTLLALDGFVLPDLASSRAGHRQVLGLLGLVLLNGFFYVGLGYGCLKILRRRGWIREDAERTST